MGKIVVSSDKKGPKCTKHEHIVKIMFDDNEPPKNYLWHKPNGILYEYKNGEWVPINKRPDNSEYVNREELEKYIREQILAKLGELSEFLTWDDLNGFATKMWVLDQDFGKNVDLSDYVTAREITNISELDI